VGCAARGHFGHRRRTLRARRWRVVAAVPARARAGRRWLRGGDRVVVADAAPPGRRRAAADPAAAAAARCVRVPALL
jgi:hypothetical protein